MEAMHEASTRAARKAGGIKFDDVDLSHHAMVIGNLKTWAESQDTLDDLKVAIIRNDTDVDFITSDDPAVLTNRVHLQTLKSDKFGLIACGVQLYMPLTPRLAVVAYDKDAYSAPRKSGNWIPVVKEADVRALNDLQYLNSEENIYFHRWDDRSLIAAEFADTAAGRIAVGHRLWVGTRVGRNGDGELYKRATEDEISTLGTKIVSVSPVFPTPQRWFGELRFRDKVWAWYPETGTGLFRQNHAYAKRFGTRFRRVRVHPGLRLLPGPDGPQTLLHKRRPA